MSFGPLCCSVSVDDGHLTGLFSYIIVSVGKGTLCILGHCLAAKLKAVRSRAKFCNGYPDIIL